jgi:hypothetical protein
LALLATGAPAEAPAHKETNVLQRPPSEEIPSAAKMLRITAIGPLGHPAPIPPITVTKVKTVRAIATAIDELPRQQPGVYACPSDNGSSVSFAFRATGGGPLLAWVKAEATGCGIVEVGIGDHKEPLLTDGYRLIRKAKDLLGPLGRRLPKPL